MKVENYIDSCYVDTVANDSSDYVMCMNHNELYSDFKFVTETLSTPYKGPVEREVAFVSAGWNFVILFFVMILVVLNKYFAPRRFATIITIPFQGAGSEKVARETPTFFNLVSLSIIISFILIVSMFIQKFYLIYGENYILHDNINFFFDITFSVALMLVFSYLFTLLYSWLFNSEAMIVMYVGLYVSMMASTTLILIPAVMILLFYPYKFIFITILVILLLLFAWRIIKLLIEVRMFSKLNFVNIFLYLCTVEILPILVILKLVLMVI
ncbi:MAG: DUF4271 domain-containing protein [Bacteroidales bacterium]|nr:DUF4271 domain-containing protein [Bacteroidales bacterium]